MRNWKRNLEKLKNYHKLYGHFNVPTNWKVDMTLSRFIQTLRRSYPNLPLPLIDELEALGFDWNPYSHWEKMLSEFKEFVKTHNHPYVPANIDVYTNLFNWVKMQQQARGILTQKQVKALDKWGFSWENLSNNDQRWHTRYNELKKFKEEYGHTQVSESFKEIPKLGEWVLKQRTHRNKNKLKEEYIKLLDELGFLWSEDIRKLKEDKWEQQYQALKAYKEKHGAIDRLAVLKENYSLGLWIETQMVWQHKISQKRKEKLDSINFIWEKEDINEEKWDSMYQQLVEFKEKHGHCRVKRKDNYRLSIWCQRHKNKKHELSEERRRKLEELGFKWSYELFAEKWETMYKRLIEFKKANGHLSVPRTDIHLFYWIQDQKKYKEEKRMSNERLRKLEAIGFLWSGEIEKENVTNWEIMFEKYVAFREKYGSKYILKLKEDPKLEYWVGRQSHNKHILSVYKREKLNSFNFPWLKGRAHDAELWEEMYAELLEYKKKHGHCDVPTSNNKENPKLGGWVNSQRTKESRMPEHRKSKLNEIGFSWGNEVLEKRWEQRLDEAIAVIKEHGYLKVHSQSQLGSWIYQQKKHFDRLPEEKKRKLVEIEIIIKKNSLES